MSGRWRIGAREHRERPGAASAGRCPRAAGWRGALLAGVAVVGVAACVSEPETISREDFVGTYVGLRLAELRGSETVIATEVRDSVLAARGVSEEDLTAFAELHGDDPVYMARVWGEVEDSLEEYTSRPDTVR